MYVFKRNQWESKKSYLDRWCGLLHAADYRKHTEIIASEPLSENVKNKGKLKVFTNNALIHATSDMNFTNKDPDITYSIALRKGKFYTKWDVNLTKVKFLFENFIDQKMRTEGHRSIAPWFSMHAVIEAALVKLSFVIKNHKNEESTFSQVQMFTDVYSVKLKRKKTNLFQLLKNTKEVWRKSYEVCVLPKCCEVTKEIC